MDVDPPPHRQRGPGVRRGRDRLPPGLRCPPGSAGRGRDYGGTEDYLSKGNTTIVAPGGTVLQGPLVGEAGAVTAALDLDRIAAGRRAFDPTGHYSRPDVLTLTHHTNGDDA